MVFLIDYDRKAGAIRSMRSFDDTNRKDAERIRLEMEIANRTEGEIVLLESDDEETLRKTHARYFKTPTELLQTKTG